MWRSSLPRPHTLIILPSLTPLQSSCWSLNPQVSSCFRALTTYSALSLDSLHSALCMSYFLTSFKSFSNVISVKPSQTTYLKICNPFFQRPTCLFPAVLCRQVMKPGLTEWQEFACQSDTKAMAEWRWKVSLYVPRVEEAYWKQCGTVCFFSPIIFRKLDSSTDFLAQLSDLWADSDWYEFVEESPPPGLSRYQKF